MRTKRQIFLALARAGGTVSVAASYLGISRATFYRLAIAHGIIRIPEPSQAERTIALANKYGNAIRCRNRHVAIRHARRLSRQEQTPHYAVKASDGLWYVQAGRN